MIKLIIALLFLNPALATIIPDRDDSGKMINHSSGVPRDDKVRVRFIGTHDFTIAGNQTAQADWTIPQLQFSGQNVSSFFRGGNYKVVGGCDGDKLKFQITDPTGAAVLEEFGTDWFVFADSTSSIREHKASLPATYRIRVVYQSTCATAARFIFNLFRYIETS